MAYGVPQYGIGQYGRDSGASVPTFRRQDPAPGAASVAADTTVYAEVYDPAGGLVASSVSLYINGTLAWQGDKAAPGFSGTRVSAALGYAYTISLPSPFEPGTQTVRGTATNSAGRGMDESYSFTTVAPVVTEDDVREVLNQLSGLDLYLDTTGHDLEVDGLDLRLVAGVDEVIQHLKVGLKLLTGEWYLDDLAGMPYFRELFVDAPNSRAIETIFRQEILGDPDVERLAEFSLALDRATRHLDVAFRAISSVGEVEVSAVFP